MDDVLRKDWRCIRCKNPYEPTVARCERCNLPRFYSQEKIDALLKQHEHVQRQRLVWEWERLRQEQVRLQEAQQQLTADRQRFEVEWKRLAVTMSREERPEAVARCALTVVDTPTSTANT